MSASNISRAWSVGCCLSLALGLIMMFAPATVRGNSESSHPVGCTCHTWDDPVVEQGEWHTIHALQINCSACHDGNGHATDQATAHAGLIPNPLNDPQQSCQQCHPADFQQRTAGVAVALGLTPSRLDRQVPLPAAIPAAPIITPWPQITLRGWDWPVELAIAIVVAGIGVMRWRRVHSAQ